MRGIHREWARCSYNPYLQDTFEDEYGNPVHEALCAIFDTNGTLWVPGPTARSTR